MGKWAISSKNKITTYNISHHANSFMPKVFLSVSLAAAAARCFALAWQIAIHHRNIQKLGDFSSSSRADEYDSVLAWENHTKFLIETKWWWLLNEWQVNDLMSMIPNWGPLDLWKTPGIHGESRFGLSHLIGKINIFQLSYQFSLGRAVLIWSCCQCDNYSGEFFKKIWKFPKTFRI